MSRAEHAALGHRSLAAALLAFACLAACSLAPGAAVAGHPTAPATARAPEPAPVPTPTPIPPLSLAGLFHPAAPVAPDPSHLRTLIATGDFIPAREVNVQAGRRNDFLWTVRPTADFVRNADLTFVNLETPLFTGCRATDQGFQFCGDARHVEALKAIGADVVNLANNHLGNYGPAGTQATAGLLAESGMATCGLGPPAVLDVRGIKFAFVGYNGVGVPVDRPAMVAGIKQARALADVVVVQFHWGKEYERQPLPDPGVPTPDDPVQLGHLAVDAGADLVIGNHPHWYQGIEIYRNRLITYAHGNYVFDQMWSEETREGVIGTYTFYDNHLVAASWKPIRIYDYGQARFEDAAYDQRVLATMEEASRTLAARLGEPTA